MLADLPSGASAFWTLDDGAIRDARALVERGALTDADALLAAKQAATNGEVSQACSEGREIIRRIRLDYSLSAEGLLQRVRKVLTDATAEDMERWRVAGQAQYRLLDGAVCYADREPGNIWRLCDEAKRRRAVVDGWDPAGPAPLTAAQRKLIEHLGQVVTAARRTGRTEVEPVQHRIRYKLTVHANRPGARAGSRLRAWLPFPQEYGRQREVRLIDASPDGFVVSPNFVDTCPPGGAAHRTIHFEHVLADVTQPVTFSAVYEYVSHAYYPRLSDAAVRPCVREDLEDYLCERPPHIRFTPGIREAAERIIASEANPLARARRIFHWFEENHRYAYEEEYSTIPSLCEKAFRRRQGDCGVKAMLFITMCRLVGVPARFQSGWATFPDYWSMHDWAEIYVEPWGWLPVDPSYGVKPSADAEVREFYFGHQDAYRMIVNLDYGREFHPPKQDLRSETADFQRGEVELDGRNLYFDEWDYEFGFDVEPAGGSS